MNKEDKKGGPQKPNPLMTPTKKGIQRMVSQHDKMGVL